MGKQTDIRDNEEKRRYLPLKLKFSLMFLAFTLVLVFIAGGISYTTFKDSLDTYYMDNASQLAATQATFIDKDALWKVTERVETIFGDFVAEKGYPNFEEDSEEDLLAYLALFDEVYEMPEYETVMQGLRAIYDNNTVASCYFGSIDLEHKSGIYLIDCDREGDDACPVGYFDSIGEEQMEKMLAGNLTLDPYITNTGFGWLVTAAANTFEDDDTYIVQSYIDISMDQVVAERNAFMRNLFITLLLVAAIIISLAIAGIGHFMIEPIKQLDRATASFVSDKHRHGKDVTSEISRLNVRTRDEVEDLAGSVKKMESEINEYIDNITEITAENERIGAELTIATRIQADMLPTVAPDSDAFNIFASMTPAKEVGGDFYDFFMIDESHLAVVMADVSGKGVPAALFMVIGKTLINNQSLQEKDLGAVFTKVNNLLCDANKEGLFITAYEAVIDLNTGDVTFVNAGHEQPFIYSAREKAFKPMKIRSGFVLAGMEDIRYRTGTFKLEKGDKLFQYTDGVTEATNAKKELFGMERLEKVLNTTGEKSPVEILRTVKAGIDDFVADAEQFDDITMLCVEYKGGGNSADTLTVKAEMGSMPRVTEFIEERLEKAECSSKAHTQINIAIDELASNVMRYAYPDGAEGELTVGISFTEEGRKAVISFSDNGIPFNPLEREDPDITLSAEERGVGGLGIFMVKKTMDDIRYERTGDANVLTIEKTIK